MAAFYCFEELAVACWTIRYHNPEDQNMNLYCRGSLRLSELWQ